VPSAKVREKQIVPFAITVLQIVRFALMEELSLGLVHTVTEGGIVNVIFVMALVKINVHSAMAQVGLSRIE
jgi:hypothetical protein